MSDPRENPETDVYADARRQLLQIEAEIQATGRDYYRIVHEGAQHFGELHKRAAKQIDEGNVDEYVEQAHAMATMTDRHAVKSSRVAKL